MDSYYPITWTPTGQWHLLLLQVPTLFTTTSMRLLTFMTTSRKTLTTMRARTKSTTMVTSRATRKPSVLADRPPMNVPCGLKTSTTTSGLTTETMTLDRRDSTVYTCVLDLDTGLILLVGGGGTEGGGGGGVDTVLFYGRVWVGGGFATIAG